MSKQPITIENAPASPERTGKGRGHCQRLWWAWLTSICLLVLIVMLVIVYAVIPTVGQKAVNNTVLTLHSLTIHDPKPDSLVLSLNSTISGAGGVAAHAHLDSFEVDFFLQSRTPVKPFMSLQLPGIAGGSNIPVVTTDTTTSVSDVAAMIEFSAALLGSEVLNIGIRGRTTLWVGRLHAKVGYDEVVTIKGFNHLQGMQIEEYSLLDAAKQADGSNLGGKVLIPNPTVVEIEMGDVHIDMSLGGTALGNGTIPSLTIRPGNYTYDFRAKVASAPLVSLAMALARGSPAVLDVRGSGVDVEGKSIPWLAVPMGALAVKVPVKPAKRG